MRVTVDRGACLDKGRCAIAAPEVFQLDDEGHLVYDPNPDDSLRSKVEDAVDGCPTQAISIED